MAYFFPPAAPTLPSKHFSKTFAREWRSPQTLFPPSVSTLSSTRTRISAAPPSAPMARGWWAALPIPRCGYGNLAFVCACMSVFRCARHVHDLESAAPLSAPMWRAASLIPRCGYGRMLFACACMSVCRAARVIVCKFVCAVRSRVRVCKFDCAHLPASARVCVCAFALPQVCHSLLLITGT